MYKKISSTESRNDCIAAEKNYKTFMDVKYNIFFCDKLSKELQHSSTNDSKHFWKI